VEEWRIGLTNRVLKSSNSEAKVTEKLPTKNISANCVEADSMIVRNRLVKKNVIFKKYPSSQRMFALATECLGIMNRFGKFDVVWKGRANNVERFGH
jgi:hypothetical protein